MEAENHYKDIKHVIQLNSDKEYQCELCRPLDVRRDLTENINHLITKHDYKLLHIGPETKHANDSGSWHYTVAILGI